MFSREQDGACAGGLSGSGERGVRLERSIFIRHALQRPGILIASLVTGLLVGICYRYLIEDTQPDDWGNYARSAVHGMGLALTAWVVHTTFASNTRSDFGSALRRLPLWVELLIRSLVMTIAFIVVGVALQLVLYAEPLGLHWFTSDWFRTSLPSIVAIGFAISLVFGALTEMGRLIGGPVLTSVILGTYHRPVREELIVMFLDIASSTRLAEEMGELRVHDLITRFFFDIDEPISDHGGTVHAYVGDEVIITWPITRDPVRNTRCLHCLFAIEHKMARLGREYEREFGTVPSFRAGLHAGPVIVSECGDAKRQLAYFGDTMNVAARLCEYCKGAKQPFVISSELLHQAAIPSDLELGEGTTIKLRGRREPVDIYSVRQSTVLAHSA
ncbi:MAG: adenylate/guanylate cyclase domain-containing protein [Hyphomicrobiales bacterium]|nr:adenylate/guanylate cyclase domain-containing protein [Hyphomicrobiales bacterium]